MAPHPPLPPLHGLAPAELVPAEMNVVNFLAERTSETDTNLVEFFRGDWSKLKAGGSEGPVFEETPDDKEHIVYGKKHGPWEHDENFTLFPRSTHNKAIKPSDFYEKNAAVVSAEFQRFNPEFYKALVDACNEWFKAQEPKLKWARLDKDFSSESSDTFYFDMGPMLLQVRVDKMVSKLQARRGVASSYVVVADVPNYAMWEQRGVKWGHYTLGQGFPVANDNLENDYRKEKLTDIAIIEEGDDDEYQLDWKNPKLDERGKAISMALSYLESNGKGDYKSFLMRVVPPTVAAKVAFARITVRVVKDRAADTGYVDKPFSMKFGVPHDWEGGAQGWTPEKFSWLRERLAEFPVFDLHQLRDKLADIERTNVDAAAAASFAAASQQGQEQQEQEQQEQQKQEQQEQQKQLLLPEGAAGAAKAAPAAPTGAAGAAKAAPAAEAAARAGAARAGAARTGAARAGAEEARSEWRREDKRCAISRAFS